jgi:hypothetical protein
MDDLKNQKGFTLLLAALVASITLALGAAIYSIAIKQVTLSGIGRDSQFAFYNADTIAECALYQDNSQSMMPTSTLSGTYDRYFTCDGVPVDLTVVQTTGTNQTGNVNVPADWTGPLNTLPGGPTGGYNSITITVYGGSGGGGGGSKCSAPPPQNGQVGQASSFSDNDGLGVNILSAPGGGGAGGSVTCAADGRPGGDGNGGCGSAVGLPGGQGGFSTKPGGTPGAGGTGGLGGVACQTFDDTSLPPSTNVTLSIGAGGLHGNGSGAGLPGADGSPGYVHLDWVGSTAAWAQSTYEFTMQLSNGECAHMLMTKKANGANGFSTTIHSDGYNVACAAVDTDPHALQRSVELLY